MIQDLTVVKTVVKIVVDPALLCMHVRTHTQPVVKILCMHVRTQTKPVVKMLSHAARHAHPPTDAKALGMGATPQRLL